MSGIDALASSQITAALIASALYFVTYLSFVRLLRYWRNWYRPTLSASFLTAVLATATVVYTAFSPQGMSLPAMALSAGFIVLLFSLIAAPAIAFEPGTPRPIIEFLAKYGEYSGLWMIPPAILAGFMLPEAKMLGLLVAAIALELAWFFRFRRGATQSYPYDPRDLLVLQTQANGNVEKFAKQHGIKELKMSPDGSAT